MVPNMGPFQQAPTLEMSISGSLGNGFRNSEIRPIFSLMTRKSTAYCVFELKPKKVKFHPNRHENSTSSTTAKLHHQRELIFAGSLSGAQQACRRHFFSFFQVTTEEAPEDRASAQGQNLNSQATCLSLSATFIYFYFYVLALIILFPSRW